MASSNLNLNAKKVDNFIKAFLKRQKSSGLLVPMKYGIISGGKKIRSTLIFSTGKIFNLKKKDLIYLCSAVECIHSYSLIHDDLPCMDNDKFRRGKLSTHAKFGESTAVLAGNSLLTLAFEILSSKDFKVKPQIKIELIKNLANCSGHSGIAGGQELDLKFEKKRVSFNKTLNMQRKKTGKLFQFCCLAPAILANKKKKEKLFMSKLGEDIGLLFQLVDDFLDVRGKKSKVGKPIKKDKKKGKSTLIRLLGYEKAQKYALNLKINILRKLEKHGKKAYEISKIIEFVHNRKF
jgi:farnesyl diphosphate synthase